MGTKNYINNKKSEANIHGLPGSIHPYGKCSDIYGNGWCDGIEITVYDPYVKELTGREVEVTVCPGVLEGYRQDT